MSDTINDLVRKYLDVWNERDGDRRRAAIDTVFTEDCGYTDPDDTAVGRDAVADVVGRGREKLGDLIFSLDNLISVHHDLALFTWRLGPPGAAEPVVTGYDVAVFEDGRVRQIYGFFDPK